MFEGFTPETFDFLWGIRMNNNREWFNQHKKQYTETLYEPMKALGKELFTPFLDKPGSLLKVSRIYRDARLHYPVPYKESLWICIRQDVQWWAENPCMYFEIRPEGASCGFIHWQPKTTTMESFRKEITRQPDAFLSMLEKVEKDTGIAVTAECYKRPAACEDARLQNYIGWRRNIECTKEFAPGNALFTPELSAQVQEFFRQLMPLYDFFTQFTP